MTSNQIAYAKVREEERTNRENEAIRRRSNDLTAQANMIKQYEATTQRENAETNRLQAMNSAQQNALRAQEISQNYILATAQQAETQRHNYAAETEAATQRVTSQQIEGTKVRANILSGLINVAGNLMGKFFH